MKESFQMKIFVTMFLSYMSYNWNRKSVSVVLPELINNGLRTEVAGSIVSSQNLAYSLSKFFSGILSDKTKPHILLMAGLLFSGIATIIFPFCESPAVYVVLWFCNGLAQGFGWPACSKMLLERFPESLRGTLWGILSCSANVSGALNAMVGTYLAMHFGWQASLVFAALISFLMASVCLLTIGSPPSASTLTSSKPKVSVNSSKARFFAFSGEEQISWKDLRNYPSVWLIAVCYFVCCVCKTCFTDWTQVYLIDDLQVTAVVASSFVVSFELGGAFGSTALGYMSDFIGKTNWMVTLKPFGSRRILLAFLLAFGLTINFHVFCFHLNALASEMFLFILGFLFGGFIYGAITVFGLTATEIVPNSISGTSHAIVAFAGNMGSVFAGLPFASIAVRYSWWSIFFALEILSCIMVALMLFYRNREPAFGKRKD